MYLVCPPDIESGRPRKHVRVCIESCPHSTKCGPFQEYAPWEADEEEVDPFEGVLDLEEDPLAL